MGACGRAKPGSVISSGSPGDGLPSPDPARREERVLPRRPRHGVARETGRPGDPGGVIGPSSTSARFIGLTGSPVAQVSMWTGVPKQAPGLLQGSASGSRRSRVECRALTPNYVKAEGLLSQNPFILWKTLVDLHSYFKHIALNK